MVNLLVFSCFMADESGKQLSSEVSNLLHGMRIYNLNGFEFKNDRVVTMILNGEMGR